MSGLQKSKPHHIITAFLFLKQYESSVWLLLRSRRRSTSWKRSRSNTSGLSPRSTCSACRIQVRLPVMTVRMFNFCSSFPWSRSWLLEQSLDVCSCHILKRTMSIKNLVTHLKNLVILFSGRRYVCFILLLHFEAVKSVTKTKCIFHWSLLTSGWNQGSCKKFGIIVSSCVAKSESSLSRAQLLLAESTSLLNSKNQVFCEPPIIL